MGWGLWYCQKNEARTRYAVPSLGKLLDTFFLRSQAVKTHIPEIPI